MRPASMLTFLASVVCMLALAVAHDALEPPLVALKDLRAWEGQEVRVQALATRALPVSSGAQLLTLADEHGHAAAFLTRPSPPLEGAELRVTGVVERNKGSWELRASAADVLRAASEPISADEAARLAPALGQREWAVRGTLRWPTGSPPVLAGGAAKLPIAFDEPWRASPLVGREVLARGTLRFEPTKAQFFLQVRAFGLVEGGP